MCILRWSLVFEQSNNAGSSNSVGAIEKEIKEPMAKISPLINEKRNNFPFLYFDAYIVVKATVVEIKGYIAWSKCIRTKTKGADTAYNKEGSQGLGILSAFPKK